MTCTTTDFPRRGPAPSLTLIERWHRRLQRRRANAVAERALRRLDDHLLRDIGIERADIAAELRRRG
ncbi:MAG TPA: DUF1127 domain-containing protein [Amaricoccus sp.]|nr:DUF1127 domain-containing protein [Amaricoccus sp.]